jgi:protein TonB
MLRGLPARSLVEQFPRSPDAPVSALAARGLVPRGGALVFSLLAHAAVAAAVVQQGTSFARALTGPEPKLVEIVAPELDSVPKAAEAAPVPAVTPTAVVTQPIREPVHAFASRPSPATQAPEGQPPGTPEPAVAVAPVAATTPHFVMAAAPVFEASASATVGNVAAAVARPIEVPLGEHEVDVGPVLIAGAPPAYPAGAQAAGVEASVPVELVIDAHGAVQSVVVLTHVGYGLDEAAVTALRSYRFTPARRAGRTVAVRKRWITRFELR